MLLAPGHATASSGLGHLHRSLQRRYHVQFSGFTLMQYRDGGDGQAFHRDTDMRWLDDTVIAVLTLGARRPWLLRPRSERYRAGRPVRWIWRQDPGI